MSSRNLIDEIQLLRSISIIFVILFHFDLLGFKGGFVGVDIFFTISGFLITSIILKEKNFSFTEFYFKRAKRILPSLYLVIILSLFFGYFFFSSLHFDRLVVSSKFSLAALSNYFFYQEAGYFDQNKLFKPLLHTWSLAVEMQYYIFWPLVLIILKNFFKNLFLPIFFILIISLSFSFLYSDRTDGFFYFTGFRLYEFCIGSLIFLILKKKKFKNDYLFYLGFVAIFISSMFYDSDLGLPSIYPLLPCIGASLIIIYRIPEKIIFLKKNFFLNYTAKISYTLYLFHWPILIFYSYQKASSLIIFEKLLLIVFTYLVSILIYEFYEKKIRYFKTRNVHVFLILIIAVPFIFNFANSFAKFENKQITEKFEKNFIIKEVFEGRRIKNNIEDEIFSKIKKGNYFDYDLNKQNFIVVGDSHAFDLYLAINNYNNKAKEISFFYQNFEYLYCFKKKEINDKIIDFLNYKILKRRNSCKIALGNFNKDNLKNANALIISNRWPIEIDYEKVLEYFLSSNKNLILVSNGHRFYDIPTLFFKKKGKVNDYAKNILSKKQINIPEIESLKKRYKINFFDKSKVNCNPNCIVYFDGILLYSDEDHWSYDSMKYFGKKLDELEFFSIISNF